MKIVNVNRAIFAGGLLLFASFMYFVFLLEEKEHLQELDRQQKEKQVQESALRATMYLNNGNYTLQTKLWQLSKLRRSPIVMLGNSHTFYGNWAELLGRPLVANRGIPGDITLGYLHRMNYVYALKPKICFIEGGVNDFYSGYTVAEVLGNYTQILNGLTQKGITAVIQATFLVGTYWPEYEQKNRMINELNTALKAMAQERGLIVIDLNPLIAPQGFLRPELTYDGLHLNAEGYGIWVPQIEQALRQLGQF